MISRRERILNFQSEDKAVTITGGCSDGSTNGNNETWRRKTREKKGKMNKNVAFSVNLFVIIRNQVCYFPYFHLL